jgi:hypothetical protein
MEFLPHKCYRNCNVALADDARSNDLWLWAGLGQRFVAVGQLRRAKPIVDLGQLGQRFAGFRPAPCEGIWVDLGCVWRVGHLV